METKMARLENKVAFITGAGSGIARTATQIFAREGAKVVIAEINQDLGQESERLTREAGGDASFIQTDVTKEDSVKNAIQATVERYGKLDILYNSAGGSIVEDTTVTDVDMSVWPYTQSLDLLGTFLCCRHGIPEIIKAGGGAVVNTSSMVAVASGSFRAHVYVAAKGAIIALTQALAGEYAKHNVRVNTICPGGIVTDRTRQRLGDPDQIETIKILREQYPYAIGEPEDIAYVALFLASDEARILTGTTIQADGGPRLSNKLDEAMSGHPHTASGR
jgi:NAD(P)-dependent dehydrogenase (short-subunit alcohol dehydrogenase family)